MMSSIISFIVWKDLWQHAGLYNGVKALRLYMQEISDEEGMGEGRSRLKDQGMVKANHAFGLILSRKLS